MNALVTESPERIRVLRMIARLNIGGPAIHVVLLSQKLPSPPYETRLVVGNVGENEGDMAYYAAEHGVTPEFIDGLQRNIHPIRDLRVLWEVYQLMRHYRPHIVHTHTAKAGFIGRLAAWLAGVPVIVHTFHGHVFSGYDYSPLRVWLFVTLEQLAARMSDTIITLTETLRKELAEQYHITRRGRITVLPLGLDLERFVTAKRQTGAFRKAWGIAPETPLVGIVGRLTGVKNHRLFLDAAQQIHQQRPDVRFVIVGDGELMDNIRQHTHALGLDAAVIFTGWQTDMLPVYVDLNVKVISSNNEGTPVTLIEALAAGVPVVATHVGGIPDLLEGGKIGKIVPPNDPDALAAAILQTLNTPPDTEGIRQAMIKRYGIDRLVSDIDSLYRGLLTRKGVKLSSTAHDPVREFKG